MLKTVLANNPTCSNLFNQNKFEIRKCVTARIINEMIDYMACSLVLFNVTFVV